MDQSNQINQQLLPGQKYPTPTRGFGDRVFYESLLRQRPDSLMAQEWCVYHGVLEKEEAQRLHNSILKRKGQKGFVTNTSASNKDKPSPTSIKRAKKDTKKRRITDEDGGDNVEFDAEMNVGGYDGIGVSGL